MRSPYSSPACCFPCCCPLLLRRYGRSRDSLSLIIGVGFLGTGFLDGYHALVTSVAFKHYLPSDLSSLNTWSWFASRLYLSVMLALSIAVWWREQRLGPAGRLDADVIYIGSGALTVLSFLFFALVPLPPAYYPDIPFHRPEEFVPALFFAVALAGYLRKGKWRYDTFEHWLVLALIVNLVAQVVFMSVSGRLFDFEFDAAHLLKKVSYVCVLTGLVWSRLYGGFEYLQSNGMQTQTTSAIKPPGFGIGRQIVLMVSLLIVMTVGVTTAIMWTKLRSAAVTTELQALDYQGELFESELLDITRIAVESARYLAARPSARRLVMLDDAEPLLELEHLTSGLFDLYPWYRSIRLVKRDDDSLRELMHVQNPGEATTFSPIADPLDLGVDVFDDMMAQGQQEIRIVTPTAASLYVLSLVRSPDPGADGIIAVEFDFSRVISDAATHLDPHMSFGVADARGHILLERQRAGQMRTPGPGDSAIKAALAAEDGAAQWPYLREITSRRGGADRMLGFHSRGLLFIPESGTYTLGLILIEDLHTALANVTATGRQALVAAAIVTAIALLIGWLFGRALAGPLRHIATVSAEYGKHGVKRALPVEARDEIGVVARALTDMMEQIDNRNRDLESEIAERKLQERIINEKTIELERSNEELAQFAYVASHDLQEPLRTVTSFVQLLERRYGDRLGDDADRYIKHAVDGCGRMKNLIEDLLRFSRVGSQGGEISPTDPGTALQQALADLAVAIDECGARVTRDELPTVLADQNQLRTLLLNLVGNGLKYRGTHSPVINVTARHVDHVWEFAITDNGIGIEPQYRERVFGVFQRLHGRSEYEGSGIGLAVCKKIVERHGGRIWLESAPGEGTTVYFTLKAAVTSVDKLVEPVAA